MIIQITAEFDSWLQSKFQGKPDIQRFLLNHERKHLCIQEVLQEIRKAELSNIGGRFEVTRYKLLIHTCAQMFANVAINHKHQQLLSSAERQRRIDEDGKYDRAAEILAEAEKEALSDKIVSLPGVK